MLLKGGLALQVFEALSHLGHPYYRPSWRRGIVVRVLEADVDWAEIGEIIKVAALPR